MSRWADRRRTQTAYENARDWMVGAIVGLLSVAVGLGLALVAVRPPKGRT